jgi:hypothetical protein
LKRSFRSKVSTKIVNEVDGVTRVMWDDTSKSISVGMNSIELRSCPWCNFTVPLVDTGRFFSPLEIERVILALGAAIFAQW